MASRKFKKDWIPTPLRADHPPQAAVTFAGAPAPAALPAAAELTGELSASTIDAVAIDEKVTVNAESAHTTSPDVNHFTPAASALAAVASSAIESAKGVTNLAAGSALSAANSAIATVRESAAAQALSSALGGVPSPIALINRASFIVKFLLRAMFFEFLRVALPGIFARKERTKDDARRSRQFVERLGGAWVTLAHLAALRSDLLGVEYCRELSRARDLAEPVDFKQIRVVVEEDLRAVGTSFDETFVEFDETPFYVRSFGQVHRARLRKSNQEVVVRVRAPDAHLRARTDWRYLRAMQFIIEQLDLLPHLRWNDLMFELQKATDDLLDYRSEVEELRKVRQVLRKRRIYVPRLYRRYCTERMLVQEHIQGVSIHNLMALSQKSPRASVHWLRENQLDLSRIWRRLFNAHHELLFEHNVFFTELNPRNIVLLKGNRMAFVSHATIGTLDADLQRRFRSVYRAFLVADYSKACDYYLTLGPALPYKDINNMRQQGLRALRKWESRTHVKSRAYSDKCLAAAVGELARCASAQELPTSWNLARLQLAEKVLNNSLEFLDPSKSSLKALRRYEQTAQIRSIKQAATAKLGKRVQAGMDVLQLNMQMMENLENDGEFLRTRLAGVQSRLSKASAIGGRMVVILSKLAVVALALQIFLYIKSGYHVSLPVAEQGTLGRVLTALRPKSTASWVVVVLLLYYFRRFLQNLARQLFTKSVRPDDVS